MIVMPARRTMQNDAGSPQNRSYSKPSLSRYQFAVATTSSTMKYGATCQCGFRAFSVMPASRGAARFDEERPSPHCERGGYPGQYRVQDSLHRMILRFPDDLRGPEEMRDCD